MKKRFFLVGALVTISMSVAFISCKKETIENGCTCTMSEMGESETVFIDGKEMKEIAKEAAEAGIIINSCSDYSDAVMKYAIEKDGASIKCK